MDLDQYRQDSRDAWDRFSRNWDEQHDYLWEHTRPISERMVERLDPSSGETVLELAAGTGDTGFLIAELVGDQGRVISTDFAPGMIEAARRRAGELGLDNVEFRVLDAERMDLDDSSVDGVVARFGYMLMADPAAAFAETRRVLRDGGRLSFAVWASPEQNLWAAIPGMALVERGQLPPPQPGTPGIFSMGDPERIRQLVTAAGFDEPSVDQVTIDWNYADSAEHWEKTLKLAAPIAEAVGGLPDDEREDVRAAVAARIDELLAGPGVGGVAHVVLAH